MKPKKSPSAKIAAVAAGRCEAGLKSHLALKRGNHNSDCTENMQTQSKVSTSTCATSKNFIYICAGCNKPIRRDKFLLKACDMYWHENCLKCDRCHSKLGELGSTLFCKSNMNLCRQDYLEMFGETGVCAVCEQLICSSEMVMRAKQNVYHLECFACQLCNQRFCVGDRFYLCENKVVCQYDYEEHILPIQKSLLQQQTTMSLPGGSYARQAPDSDEQAQNLSMQPLESINLNHYETSTASATTTSRTSMEEQNSKQHESTSGPLTCNDKPIGTFGSPEQPAEGDVSRRSQEMESQRTKSSKTELAKAGDSDLLANLPPDIIVMEKMLKEEENAADSGGSDTGIEGL